MNRNTYIVEVCDPESDTYEIVMDSIDPMDCYEMVQNRYNEDQWEIQGPDSFQDSWNNYNGTDGNV